MTRDLRPKWRMHQVMEAASSTLTPVVLELGGKDAFIVCDDADLKQVGLHHSVSLSNGLPSLPLSRVIAVVPI